MGFKITNPNYRPVSLDRFGDVDPDATIYALWAEYEPKEVHRGTCHHCGQDIVGEMGYTVSDDLARKYCWLPDCRISIKNREDQYAH